MASVRAIVAVFLVAPFLAAGGCASIDARAGVAESCASGQLESAPGRAWLKEQGWRFTTLEGAAVAYARLVNDASPWPDWFKPGEATLPIGTRFQMALGVGQPTDRPGAFGTFDHIDEVEDVRGGLAVKLEWKSRIDRVVTYEVTRPLAARVGPVGPQVDGRRCRLLAGRLSQLQMLVPPEARMEHLRIVALRPIR